MIIDTHVVHKMYVIVSSTVARAYSKSTIQHLLTETEGNSMFCGPETVDLSRGEAEARASR